MTTGVITNVSKVVVQVRKLPDGTETLEFYVESDEKDKKDTDTLSGAGTVAQFIFSKLADGSILREIHESLGLPVPPDLRIDLRSRDANEPAATG